MVDELRRAVVRYQDGVTFGKAITGCAIEPVLMYLHCLIRGKIMNVDMRGPCICFMDQDKLSDLADADLIRKGNADPKTWVFGKLPVSFISLVSCKPFLGIAIFAGVNMCTAQLPVYILSFLKLREVLGTIFSTVVSCLVELNHLFN